MPITIENSTDVYRKTAIEMHSPEHIIQAGLGCNLEAVGLIDHATNVAFGGTIDKILNSDFALVRARLGLETSRGDPIRVESSSGDYDMQGDRPIQKPSAKKSPPWQVTSQPDGRTDISISADTLERAEELARHALRALGVEGAKPIDVGAKAVRTFVPPIPFEIGLGGPIHFRAVAKTCLNALCLSSGPKVVLQPAFDPIRDYVLQGVDYCDELLAGAPDPLPPFSCFDFRKELFAPLPQESHLSDLEHRLVITGSVSTRVAYATLELFGHIPYSILLTDDWCSEDFCWALVADPLQNGKGHRHFELAPMTRPALTREQVLSHALDLSAFRDSGNRLLGQLQQIVENRVLEDISLESLKSVLVKPDGKPITREQANQLVHEVAKRFIEHLYRLDSETPLPPPEI